MSLRKTLTFASVALLTLAACGGGSSSPSTSSASDSSSPRVKNAALSSCPASVTNVVTWTADVAGFPGTCTGQFVASTTWTPTAGVSSISYLAVGGGGGGQGQNGCSNSCKGGKGGTVLTGTVTITGGVAVTVTLGAGGTQNAAGTASTLVQSSTTILSAAGGASAFQASSGAGTGTTSSFSGTSLVYGANGGGSKSAGGTRAGAGANSSTDNCAGAGGGTANAGSGGGAGDYCPFSFGGGANTVGGAGGKGVVVVRYNAFSVTSFTSTAATPTSSTAPIDYTLVFSAAIDPASLTAADITNSGTSTGCTFAITSVSTTTFTVTASNCGEGTVIPQLASGSIVPASGGTGPGAAANGTTVTIDRTAPAAPSAPDLAAASDTGSSSTDNATKDNTPTMSATPVGAVTGDRITITASKDGSTPVSCSYVLPATSCDLPTLSDGTWNTSATHTDLAGNTSPASTPLPLNIDTATNAGTPDLVAASDTGSSSTDNLTKDNTPAVSADGVADGDTVTMRASKSGSTDVTCTYVKSPTVNSCDLGTLADGTWAVSSAVTDPAGNTAGPTGGLSLNVDTASPSAPSAPDLLPASDSGTSNTDNKTNDTTPTMSGGTVPDGSSVEITGRKTDGSTVSCTYVASLTVNSCDLPAMSDGTWSMSSKVTDPAGNTSPSGPALDIDIDNTAPAAPTAVDLATASDSGTSFTDNITNDDTPTVSATPAGAVAGERITMTASKAGSTPVSCSYVLPATSCDLPALSDGVWDVTAKHTDLSGNTSPASAPLPITIDTSTVPGTPDLLPTSDSGTSNSDNLTNDNTPAISADGEGNGDRIDVTARKADGSTVTCSYVKSPTVSSCDLPTMSDGDWSITTTTTDPAGNTSPASASLPIKIDTAAPTSPAAPDLLQASDSGAANNDNLTNDTTSSMSGGTVPDGSSVEITGRKTDGSTVSCTYVASPTVNSCDLPAMSDGTWSMSSKVTDPAGNTSPSGPGLDIAIDNTAPTAATAPDVLAASDTGTSDADNLTADSTPSVSLPGAADGETVTMTARKADGTTVTCSYVKSATVSSCDLPSMSDGAWKISGTITDAAGNVSAPSPALDATIDATPPAAATADLLPASDLGASDTDNNTADTTPAVGVPGAANGDEVTISAKGSDGTTVTCTYVKSATTSSCDLKTLTDGSWTVSATIVDPAGNKSAAGPGMNLVIDTKPPAKPAAPSLPVNSAGSTSNQTPEVVIDDVTPGDTATATATNEDAKPVSCVFVGAPGVRSCKLPMLTPGQWFVSATVSDASGNTSAASDPVAITINDPALPLEAVSLSAVAAPGTGGVVGATVKLAPSEVGNVANVVFVVRNADGSVARSVRVAASPKSGTVATKIAGLTKGQRVAAYTENWLGVSPAAPAGSNVVRAATSRQKSKAGSPILIGSQLAVSRVIFDPASPLLDSSDKAELDTLAAKIGKKGGLVLVSGFARQNQVDTKGFLRDLSIERAKAVANYLSARGVRAWIRYQGYGATTKQIGTWEDRKVEIRWVDGASELPTK